MTDVKMRQDPYVTASSARRTRINGKLSLYDRLMIAQSVYPMER